MQMFLPASWSLYLYKTVTTPKISEGKKMHVPFSVKLVVFRKLLRLHGAKLHWLITVLYIFIHLYFGNKVWDIPQEVFSKVISMTYCIQCSLQNMFQLDGFFSPLLLNFPQIHEPPSIIWHSSKVLDWTEDHHQQNKDSIDPTKAF